MRILYLNDSETVLSSVRNKLESQRHTVFTASTIAEARSLLEDENNRIQLMVADHNMVDESGSAVGLNYILEARASHPEIYVCVLAHQFTRSEANQMEMSGIEYFQKPVLLEKIVRHFLCRPLPKTAPPDEEKEKADEESHSDVVERGEGLLGLTPEKNRRKRKTRGTLFTRFSTKKDD